MTKREISYCCDGIAEFNTNFRCRVRGISLQHTLSR